MLYYKLVTLTRNKLDNLWNIIYGDMKKQTYYIQLLLADKLDWYKGKRDEQIEKYI